MKYFLIYFAFFLVSCSSRQTIDNPELIFSRPSVSDSLSFYFPPILNDSMQRRSQYYQNYAQKWYSSTLYSFKVPILYNRLDSQTYYRLLWLRSFHEPVCFSIAEFKGDYYFNAKTLDREPAFNYEIQVLYQDSIRKILDTVQKADRLAFIDFNKTIKLGNKQKEQVENHLSKIKFWDSPTFDPDKREFFDGSTWILEGRRNGQYHFIERRNITDELKEFGKYLTKIGGLKITKQDMY